MTASREKLLDDLAKMAGGTVGILSDASRQFREDLKSRMEDIAARLDLVPREDFEALETRFLALQKRVDALEGKTSASKPKKTTATKTAKTTKKK